MKHRNKAYKPKDEYYSENGRESRLVLGSFPLSWEQRKLGDIGETYTGLSGKTKEDFGHGDGEFVTYMNVFSNSVSNLQMTEPIEIDNNQRKVQFGDVFFTTSSETPEEVGMSSVWLGNTDNTYLNSFCFGYRPSLKIDNYYLAYMLRSDEVRKKIILLAQGISRYNISKNKVMEIAVPLPNIAEQQRVGSYFQQLDSLITLHQRKDVYKCIKHSGGYFPFRKPKTITWEQRKLGELVDRVVRKNTNNESSLPLTISAQYGLVDQITYFNNRVASRDVSNYYLVLNGEFAYNKSTSDGFPFGAVKRLDLYEKGVLSTLYIVFSVKNTEETNSDFLTVFFDTDRWHKGVAERAAEGARNHGLLNISAEDFFDIDLYLPKSEKEQAAIGAYMRSLDHLITLHQREPLIKIRRYY
ncbi:MAG: restriction endonuclease subunit S [Clostridia bacterium]|nr:restriction endonuclease subunit S [Clostridia bacterium]